MAISFFDDSSSTSGRKPFVDKYLERTNDYDSEHEVIQVAKAKSGKGLLVEAELFSVFVYADSALATQLQEALKKYVDDMHGYALVIVTQQESPYYRLGCDFSKERNYKHSQGKFTVLAEAGTTLEQEARNPFLPPYLATSREAADLPSSRTRHKQARSSA